MQRAVTAHANGSFVPEIVPVTIKNRKLGEIVIIKDEAVDEAKIAKLGRLKPAFSPTGTATPGNSSSIADGAASILLMSGAALNQRSADQPQPLARVVAYASYGHEPNRFTTAPVGAVKKLLAKANWAIGDVDLFEINEAFAVVTLASMRDLGVSPDIVNVHGGACAIGHPIGASGARIIVTLIHALKARNMTKGIAVICIGGGESTAIAIEVLHT
jgi:acetyl-CoA C-acetyltransferase